MATSSTRSVFPEPEPRFGACGTAIHNRFFIYCGFQQSFRGLRFRDLPHTFQVETFNADTTKWTQGSTTGPNPPGLWDSACTSIGSKLFSYGGRSGESFTNALCELDTTTMQWRQLQPLNPSEGPMKKGDARMIALSSNLLCVIGGYGIPSGTIHPASKFTKNSRRSDGRGYTNEVHVYNTETSMCQLDAVNYSFYNSLSSRPGRIIPKLLPIMLFLNIHPIIPSPSSYYSQLFFVNFHLCQ